MLRTRAPVTRMTAFFLALSLVTDPLTPLARLPGFSPTIRGGAGFSDRFVCQAVIPPLLERYSKVFNPSITFGLMRLFAEPLWATAGEALGSHAHEMEDYRSPRPTFSSSLGPPESSAPRSGARPALRLRLRFTKEFVRILQNMTPSRRRRLMTE